MVARHTNTTGEPPRPLSPEIEQALVDALRAVVTGEAESSTAALRDALMAAGNDAKSRGLRPEELLVAFKHIESRVTGLLDARNRTLHEAARSGLIRIMLAAYYTTS